MIYVILFIGICRLCILVMVIMAAVSLIPATVTVAYAINTDVFDIAIFAYLPDYARYSIGIIASSMVTLGLMTLISFILAYAINQLRRCYFEYKQAIAIIKRDKAIRDESEQYDCSHLFGRVYEVLSLQGLSNALTCVSAGSYRNNEFNELWFPLTKDLQPGRDYSIAGYWKEKGVTQLPTQYPCIVEVMYPDTGNKLLDISVVGENIFKIKANTL